MWVLFRSPIRIQSLGNVKVTCLISVSRELLVLHFEVHMSTANCVIPIVRFRLWSIQLWASNRKIPMVSFQLSAPNSLIQAKSLYSSTYLSSRMSTSVSTSVSTSNVVRNVASISNLFATAADSYSSYNRQTNTSNTPQAVTKLFSIHDLRLAWIIVSPTNHNKFRQDYLLRNSQNN